MWTSGARVASNSRPDGSRAPVGIPPDSPPRPPPAIAACPAPAAPARTAHFAAARAWVLAAAQNPGARPAVKGLDAAARARAVASIASATFSLTLLLA